MNLYNNIPQNKNQSSSNSTVQYFNTFYQTPISLKDSDIAAVTGFFESAGFDKQSADSVAMIILSQAKISAINPFELLDSLRKINGIELSNIVGQILNLNRFKTSILGIAPGFIIADEIQRNILA
jgi:hypothetical protein